MKEAIVALAEYRDQICVLASTKSVEEEFGELEVRGIGRFIISWLINMWTREEYEHAWLLPSDVDGEKVDKFVASIPGLSRIVVVANGELGFCEKLSLHERVEICERVSVVARPGLFGYYVDPIREKR